MEKQTKPKPLGLSMAKKILVVAIIAFLGVTLGVAGWVAKNKETKISQPLPTAILEKAHILSMEISPSKEMKNSINAITFSLDYPTQRPKAVVVGKNLAKVEFYQQNKTARPLLGDRVEIFGVKTKSENGLDSWETLLPRGYLLKFCAVGYDLSGLRVGEICRENIFVGYLFTEESIESFDISNLDMGKWKIYKSNEYQFEFKYPSEFKVLPDSVTGYKNTEALTTFHLGSINVDIYDKTKWEEIGYCQSDNDFCEYGEIDNLPVFVNSGATDVASYNYVYIVMDKYVVEFRGNVSDIYPNLLSTFKFIEKEETVDWKTYRNEEYGYEIKYPMWWSYKIVLEKQVEFREKEKTYSIEESDTYAIGIFIDESTDNLTVEQIAEARKSESGFPVEIKTLIVGNTDAAQTIDYLQQSTIIVKDNKIYKIVTPNFGNNDLNKSVREVYDKMLSTFRFAETDETADWKTYRNEEYGFEMKYPENFFPEQVLQPKTKVIQCDYANFINNCPTGMTTINGAPFCLQKTDGAAAGTTYATYNYTTVRNKECFVVSFTVPYPNCSNLLPIENQEIQEAYDKCKLDNEVTKPKTIDQILSTFKFTEK